MAESIDRIAETIRRWRRFLRYDVWRIGRPGEEAPDGFVIKQIRVAILLVQNFIENKLFLRAAALTFVTLLSIVPALALMWFAIDKFDLGEVLYDFVETNTAWIEHETPVAGSAQAGGPTDAGDVTEVQADERNEALWTSLISTLFRGFGDLESERSTEAGAPVSQITDLAKQSTDTGALGLAGAAFVLATVIGLIRNIESSFNSIWGLKNTRGWYRMFSDYVMVIVLLPVVVAFALTVTSILESEDIANNLGRFGSALRGVQYVLIWLGFTALYFVVPNTHVRIRYALLSGVGAGTAWCVMSFVYVKLQFGLGRLDALYTSFSVIPLLIMWIYLSWIILLLGAELTYAYQNEKTFAMERWAAGASYAYREALAVRAMIEIARRFDAGESGMPATESAEEWHVPTRLLNETLDQLEDAGLVAKCATDPVTYVPARSLDRISSGDVVAAVREAGRDPSELRDDPALQPLLAQVAGSENEVLRAPVTDWVRRMHPPRQVLPAGDTDHNILQLNDSASADESTTHSKE
jgi:membrane protein